MKQEIKRKIVREWMSLFGSFWAAALLVLLAGAWKFHTGGSLPDEKSIVVVIACAWLAIYLAHFPVGAFLALRRKP